MSAPRHLTPLRTPGTLAGVVRCYTQAARRIDEIVAEELRHRTSALSPRSIVIKPNWVLHETDPAFPIQALVTDSRLIEAVVLACLRQFPSVESILVGDCPLQWGDWPLMVRQCGLEPVVERLAKISDGRVVFRDLRREVFSQADGTFLRASDADHGDPKGYVEVELGAKSHLEPISAQARRFAVNDYSASVTSSNHRLGSHRYFVSRSLLDADLFINLPKWKSHQKSGLTAALKNLVGINGDKAYLPHFRKGAPKWGGDEYRDENRWLYYAQTTLREGLQKRSQWAFKALKPGWELLKKARGIQTRMPDRENLPGNFYVAGGGWHGNDTIWRMIYDLNYVIRHADAQGRLQQAPPRASLCLVDGLVAGEGNGPLQPLARDLDWIVGGDDPFAVDAALCWFMGFALDRVPIVKRHREFAGTGWGDFDLETLPVAVDGQERALPDWDMNFHFVAPPGWRSHVER